MAINDEIAAGGRPVQFENPLNNMVKFANIQNDMANMALHKQKMATDAASTARQNELNNYLGSGGRDPNRIYQLGGQEALNHINQANSARITGEKTEGETLDAAIKRGRGIFQDFVRTPEQARQFTYMQFADPVMKKYMESLGVSFEQAVARIPTDPAEFRNYREQYVVGMDKHLDNLAFKTPHIAGDHILLTNTRGEVGGQPMDITLTPKEQLDAFPGLQEAQASRKQLVEDIKQGATNMQNTASSPELASVFQTQQAARYEELAKLDKDIIGMKTKANETTRAPSSDMQLVNELSYLEANNLGKSPRATHVRALLAKQEHIAETEAYTPAGLDLAADMVRNGVVPPRGGKGAINAAAAAGVTAKDFVTGKANIAGLTQVTKTEAQTGAFENTFVKNAEATLQMGRRIGKSGVPIIDEYLANPAARASGKNPELAAYDVFIKGTLNEYAKIVSGALGNTAVAQNEIKKMEKLLNSAQTTEQLENAVNAMITETRNRRWGFKAQKAEILGQPEPAAPVNKFNLETKEVMVNGKKIKAVKGEDGKWYPK